MKTQIKKIVLITACSLGALLSEAQYETSIVPGYLGKRFSVNASAHLTPTIIFNVPTSSSGETKTGLDKRFNLFIDYAIGRSKAMGFSMHKIKTFYNQPIDGTFGQFATLGVSATTYNLTFSGFFDGLAPIGPHTRSEYGYVAITVTDDEGYFGEKDKVLKTTWDILYALNFSDRIMLTDNLALNASITLGIPIKGFVSFGYDDGDEYDPDYPYGPDDVDVIAKAAQRRIYQHYLSSVGLGIGYVF